MSDLLQIELGTPPWAPAADIEERVRLDEYNIPLAGIIEQHGVPFLYVCAAGEESDANAWLYAHLNSEDIERLQNARGRSLLSAMAECLKHRMIVAALASDFRIKSTERFDIQDETPGSIVRRFVRLEQARLVRTQGQLAALDRDRSIDRDQDTLELAFN